MRTPAIAIALVLLTFAGSPAPAADVVASGMSIMLRAGRASSLVVKLADPAIPDPPPGSADDPSVGGLVLTLFGRSQHEVDSVYPAPNPEPGWRISSRPPYRYTLADTRERGRSNIFRRAVLRGGKLIELRAPWGGLPFNGPAGSVAVRVEIGTTRVCALFDGASVRRDEVGVFVARNAPRAAFADCDDATLAAVACSDAAMCDGDCPPGSVCESGPAGCTCVTQP